MPIRDQLIEQIALQIASGALKGKEKLPSIRALAQRLGIHYSTVTAAYNHLGDVGLLEVRQGSGVRVAGKAAPALDESINLDEIFRNFMSRMSDHGYSRADLKSYMQKALECVPVKRILAVDANLDFHTILKTELTPHFELPVETCTVQELIAHKEWMTDSLIVTSLYHLFSFQDLVPDPTRLVACNIEPGRNELSGIDNLAKGSIVSLVSVSLTMLNMATKLIAAIRGDEIAVRSVLCSDEKELTYMMKHSDLVICDSPSETVVKKFNTRCPMTVFHLYSATTVELIKDRLKKWG